MANIKVDGKKVKLELEIDVAGLGLSSTNRTVHLTIPLREQISVPGAGIVTVTAQVYRKATAADVVKFGQPA